MTGRGYASTRWNFFSTQHHRKEWRHKQKQTSDFDQAASAWWNKNLTTATVTLGVSAQASSWRRDETRHTATVLNWSSSWVSVQPAIYQHVSSVSTVSGRMGIGFSISSRGQRIFTRSSRAMQSLVLRESAEQTCKESQAEITKPAFLSHIFQFLWSHYYS